MKSAAFVGIVCFWTVPCLLGKGVFAQPPTVPKPALPPLALEEMEKNFGASKRISVNFQDMPMKEALNEVGRQAGIRIEGTNLKSTATLQFKDAPFWTVMDALLVPNGLRVTGRSSSREGNMIFPDLQVRERSRTDNTNRMPRVTPQQVHPYAAILWRGATRMETRSLEYGNALSFFNDVRRSQNLSLQLAVLLDPSLHEVSAQARLRLDSVLDGAGQNLSLGNSYPQGSGEDISLIKEASTSLTLDDAGTELTKLSSVKGALLITVEMRHEVWEVLDLMKAVGVTKTFKSVNGDLTLTLLSITKENGQYQMRLQGKRRQNIQSNELDLKRGFSSFPPQNWMKRLQVFDANGNEYGFTRGNTSQSGDNIDVALTLTEQPRVEEVRFGFGDPDKLTLKVPTETRQLEIPFEVRDLPLP